METRSVGITSDNDGRMTGEARKASSLVTKWAARSLILVWYEELNCLVVNFFDGWKAMRTPT